MSRTRIIINDYIFRHFAWENGSDSLTVEGLHENWTLVLRFQVSAQPPAKKTAGQIKKETVPFWRSFIRGVRSENARAGLKPDTRHLKPMLGKGSITPDNV